MTIRIPNDKIIDFFPELKANPFADRICHIFSAGRDGRMSFEDFVDMVSGLGSATPPKVKADWAFKIFGWPFYNNFIWHSKYTVKYVIMFMAYTSFYI